MPTANWTETWAAPQVASRLPGAAELGIISCVMNPESLELAAPQHTAVKT
jgi:hypothetical protein